MGNNRLQNKVAIVTGSGQGIGAAIAMVFAEEGARVVVATRTEKTGRETVEQIKAAGGEATLIGVDIGTVNAINRVVDATLQAYGQIDIMVHNAASFLGGLIEEYKDEDLDTVLAVNLKACFPPDPCLHSPHEKTVWRPDPGHLIRHRAAGRHAGAPPTTLHPRPV